LLNERTFRRGHTQVRCPLRVCVGASNALPEDETLAAFADRFLVRVFVEPIGDPLLEDLLEAGWSLGEERPAARASIGDLDALARAARGADLGDVRAELARAVRTLRRAGIWLSDRRIVRTQRLVAGAAALAGRTRATPADLWPLIYALPTAEMQRTGREVLRDLLVPSENAALPAAAAEASLGPAARAGRLAEAARALLASATGDAAWRLRLEGVAREIDASFAADALPAGLVEVRAALVERLRP
jgi:MoxR-like ATPase